MCMETNVYFNKFRVNHRRTSVMRGVFAKGGPGGKNGGPTACVCPNERITNEACIKNAEGPRGGKHSSHARRLRIIETRNSINNVNFFFNFN